MQIVIITGLSGAGKSYAADCFEDMGYYCIDNLPPSLIVDFIELIEHRGEIEKAALIMDIRGGLFFDSLKENIDNLRNRDISFKLLFLDASDETLIRRFSETRRNHPLAVGITNFAAIKEEREMLNPIKRMADYTIDTSMLKNASFSAKLIQLFDEKDPDETFRIIIQSFGFKHGIPSDADYVFDLRFIPNPYYIPELREKTGNDADVRAYVMNAPESTFFKDEVLKIIETLMPSYIREGKRTLNISVGCTGGQHRSVTLANELYETLSEKQKNVILHHRDIPV